MPAFTTRQGQYLAFIHQYTMLQRRPPAEADIQAYFGVTPPSVHQMILTLERKKLIRRRSGEARTIQVVIPASELPALGTTADPAAGKAAGKSARASDRPASTIPKPETIWPNIDWLISGEGEVTLGSIGPIDCAATAADAHSSLAMLVRRRGESLEQLLSRLDQAIRQAVEDEIHTDEVNG